MSTVTIESSWKEVLGPVFETAGFKNLTAFIKQEIQSGKTIYPKGAQIFEAFNRTPFQSVKVVILGQDPYHGPGQAHGLSFSVNKGVPFPPSLQNIFKALALDIPGFKWPESGDLSGWADQGVLLLNATLTVRAGEAGSHQHKGWEQFTDEVIRKLNEQREHLVFLLWGSFAQNKAAFIDTTKHLVLKSVHPSPLSAHRGFLECKHFSQTNTYLIDKGIGAINWQI